MIFDWNEKKNALLKETRGVCFEDVVEAILNDDLIDIATTSNPIKYPKQKQFVVTLNDYLHFVPFIEDEEKATIFLKTIIPNRKLKKKY